MKPLRYLFGALGGAMTLLLSASSALASESDLILPDLSSVKFHGIAGNSLLTGGIAICILGLMFGLVIYKQLKALPVHKVMLDVSELIYETCKTYLSTQGKFILKLWAFIGVIVVIYYAVLEHMAIPRVAAIMAFSLVGVGGSYFVAWFGIRVNTFANSRTAFASLKGKP